MATHNAERYLKEQLDSLACQELAPDELIVCDDCSTDSNPYRTSQVTCGSQQTFFPEQRFDVARPERASEEYRRAVKEKASIRCEKYIDVIMASLQLSHLVLTPNEPACRQSETLRGQYQATRRSLLELAQN
jgi:hypothetical protein